MRFLVSIFLASILFQGTASAKNDELLLGPAPNWVVSSKLMEVPEDVSGLIFVRRQDIVVHLDDQGQFHYSGSRIKILHQNALQLGNIAISWKPASGAPTVHDIQVHRDGEVIDVLSKTSFEILRRENQLEAAMLDGMLTAVARVPDLRVGDELEIAYTTPSGDPTLGNKSVGLLILEATPPLGRFRLGLNWIKGQEPNIKMTDDMVAVVQKSKQSIELLFDNPPSIATAKDAPPRYSWQRVIEFSDFANWEVISQRFAGLFKEAASFTDASPLTQEVNRITAAHSSSFDRASAALKLVQQDVRYIYVGLDQGNLTPASADETWQRRYGDCKGKTALLLGLLAELDIEAEPVLANNAGTDDGLDQRLPNPGMFDHVLVRAKIDGKLYYLDATLPSVVPPSVDPVVSYRWVLPLTEQGSLIERIARRPEKVPNEIYLFEIDARAGFDQPAKKTRTSIVRGIKGLQQQVQLSGLAPTQLASVMRQQLVGDTWQAIDDVRWRFDRKAQASVLTITGTGMVDWDDDRGGSKSLALPSGGFSPPSKRIRSAKQDQNLPYYNVSEFNCHVTTLRFPNETRAKQWSFGRGYDTRLFGRNYYRAFDLREGSIRMIRGSRVEKQEVDAAIAKQDNDRIASFDNSMGWIYYDPDDVNDAVSSGKNLPATYDLDWTADSAACLSETVEK